MANLRLNAAQGIFIEGLKTKYAAYVGGFGSGKTFIGCIDLLLFLGRHPKTTVGYFGISYPSIRDVFYPTFAEAAELLGYRVRIKASDKEVEVYRGSLFYGTVICRSMDDPYSIVGFKISRALVDELDVLDARKAQMAWDKISARMRLVIPNVVNETRVTTTPEGFKFVYQKFKEAPTQSYSMVQASTYENAEYLPPDYISSLQETYTPELCNAYLMGRFVNLTSGSVYRNYDRVRNRSNESVNADDWLRIGMDFNVEHMAATVYVTRGDKWHAVDEFKELLDTPNMCAAIKARYPDHKVIVYPDASGQNRKSNNASESDILILKNAGFEVKVNATNPAVRDRINAVNAGFEHGRVFVNDKLCPTVAKNLEQQAWNNGEPDKKSGHDHQNDATGYPIVYEMPINKPASRIKMGVSIR